MKNSVLCYLEDTVKKFPDKVAITDSEGDVTFSQWRNRGLCIADEIRKRDDGHSFPVFVYLPKSAMTLVSFVGILYSGNYYTPTDVRFPLEKVKSIINELKPHVIITNYECSRKLIEGGISKELMLFIEEIDMERTDIDSCQYLNTIIDADLAYVLFTSGSTGVPKGVAITQRGIIDYIDWAKEKFCVTEKEIICNQAPFYFDNSILDIYLCMSAGAHLHIVPEMYYAFPAKLLDYIVSNEVNFIFWVPSVLVSVANSDLLSKIDCSCLKKILFAGEVMLNKHLNYWRTHISADIYANLYGPTEITDVCLCYVIDRKFSDDEPLPIGMACRNTQIMLLDENNKLIISPEVIGEICVRGAGLSVGYYSNQKKTDEVFVQNPLHDNYKDLIYRTGDLAHYNQFGEVMFDGRKDYQIKHMGYRIELGEIETALSTIRGIQNVCCIYDDNESEIVAIYETTAILTEREIRKDLTKLIPKYMIPTKYYVMDKLPLNDNGKINRKQLKEQFVEGV